MKIKNCDLGYLETVVLDAILYRPALPASILVFDLGVVPGIMAQ